MSKDRFAPTDATKKKGKKKRVVAVSTPAQPQQKSAPIRPGAPSKPTPAAPAPRQTVKAAQREPEPGELWHVSLEAVLFVLLAVIGFAVRLYALDRFPLQEAEGVRAWTAWGMVRGLPDVSLAGNSPLPIFGAALSFLLFGAGDVTARLLPALAGGVCVVIPYLLRRELGRSAALIAAALLAFSPSLLYVSRAMDGGMIVAAGALVLVACALAYRRDEQDRYVYIGGVTLGVMFAADTTAGPTALILGILALIGWQRSNEDRELPVVALRNALVAFAATAVLLGTGLLSNLQGVQSGLVDPLTVWFAGAGGGTLGQRVAYYARVLLAYEPLLLLFALLGLAAALVDSVRNGSLRLPSLRRSTEDEDTDADESDDADKASDDFSLTPYLALWSGLAVAFFFLLGNQQPASVVQIVLPLALLAASFAGRLIDTSELGESTRNVVLLAVVLALIVFAIIPWFNQSSLFGGRFVSLEKRIQSATAVLLALVVLGIAAVGARLAYRLRLRKTLLAAALALSVALGVYTVHSAWQLNLVNWPNATEPMLVQRTAPDMRLLLADIQAASRRQGDDAIPITVDDRLGQPLRWYLRQFTTVTTARVSATTKTPIVLVPAEAKDAISKSLGSAYVNQRYRLRSTWQPDAPLSRWLRWAHVRDQINAPKGEDLYVFYKLPQ